MSTTQLVGIYRLYKLGRMSGSQFSEDIKLLERELHPVHHSFAAESNENSNINGLLYIEDKEATKLYWDKKPYKSVKEFTPFVEVKEPVTSDTPEIAEIKNKLSEMTKEQLIDFAEKNDYKIKKTKSAENILTELIEQIEVEE